MPYLATIDNVAVLNISLDSVYFAQVLNEKFTVLDPDLWQLTVSPVRRLLPLFVGTSNVLY